MISNAILQEDEGFEAQADEVISLFSKELGGVRPDHYIKRRPDGPFLLIEFAQPAEHHYRILNSIAQLLSEDNPYKDRVAIQKRRSAPKARLSMPETQLLKNEIAESLTFDRHSFDQNFFARYTASVTSFEQQITSKANFAIYGRRGAGKSSLLAFAMRKALLSQAPISWVAMQAFSNDPSHRVVPSVISAVFFELKQQFPSNDELGKLVDAYDAICGLDDENILSHCDRLTVRSRRLISKIATTALPLTIYLDDMHVVSEKIQPLVLGYIYKITRGNNAFIKVSGIGLLTRLWDGSSQMGLQPSQDVQVLNLDHNLTMPDKSKEHIVSILDARAKYCGLPDINYLAGDDVLSRLVLVAAGVPRDSLSLFSLAISKAVSKKQKFVSVMSVNAAASEMAEEKLKDIEQDSGADVEAIRNILGDVKRFCINQNRKNAFLVEIKNVSPRYQLILKLAALRLVHVLHEGITPHKAGKRYIALMLDYGFYVGIRAARSVELIPSDPRPLLAKELRSLPIFH